MLRGCLLVLMLGVLLSPRPAEASWWRRNWPTIVTTAGKLLLGRDVASLDTNGDGLLDERELAQHFTQREDLDSFMTVADTDGDGRLTRREMEQLLGEVERHFK